MSNSIVDILINATDRASQTIRGVQEQVKGLDSAMKNAEAGSKALLGIVAGIGATMGAGAMIGLNYNRMIEDGTMQWETLLGSMDKAESQMKYLDDFAKSTPFSFSGLNDSVALMKSYGIEIDEANDYLRILGDTTSAFGKGEGYLNSLADRFGKIQATGRLMGEDLNSLASMGIPIYEILGQAFGKSADEIRDMASEGKLLADDVLPIIANGLDENFGGAMERASQSATGLISTIKDNFSKLMGSVTAPFFEHFKDGLQWILEGLSGMIDLIEAKGLKGALAEIFTPEVTAVAFALAGAIMVGLVPAFVSLAGAVWGALAPLIPFLAVGALIGLLAWQIYENWEFFAPFFEGIFELVKTYASGFYEALMNSFETLKSSLEPLWESVKTLLASLMPVIELIIGIVLLFMTTSLAVFNGVISAIGPLLTAFFNLMDVVVNVIMAIISVLTGDFDKALEYWQRATDSAIEFFKNLWEAVKGFFIGFVDTFIQIFKAFGVDLVGIFTDMFNNGKEAVLSGLDTIISTITGWGSSFMEAGMGLITGFTDGIKKAFGKAKDAVTEGLGVIRNLLPFSPAKEGPLSDLDKSGESFFPTWFEGALDNVKPMHKALSKALDDISPDDYNPQAGGLQLSFTGGRQRVRQEISVRTEHTVKIEGDGADRLNEEELEREVKETMFDDDVMRDLRQTIRKY